jgi:hypothetical protein
MGLEGLHQLGEVRERAGQSVYFIDHHHIDEARCDIGQQALKSRPLHGAAGEPAVVVAGPNELPALVGLALDIGFGGLTLGVEGVEVLFEPVLGGFAGIDRAPQEPPFRPHRSPREARRTGARSIWSR